MIYNPASTPTIQFYVAVVEEVTVTAERRATDLQTTPIAVSSLGSLELKRLQVTKVKELDVVVPSMTVENNIASNASITVAMRGSFEQNAAFLFSEPGVGLYMNGVYRRLSGSNVELADIERIEVLRGPQGTLFGRNTLAGAMNVVTRDPGKELSGSTRPGVRGIRHHSCPPFSQSARFPTRSEVPSPCCTRSAARAGRPTASMTASWVRTKFLGAMGSLAFSNDSFGVTLTAYASNNETDGQFGSPIDVTTGQHVFSDKSDVGSASVLVGGTPKTPVQ